MTFFCQVLRNFQTNKLKSSPNSSLDVLNRLNNSPKSIFKELCDELKNSFQRQFKLVLDALLNPCVSP